MRSRRGCINSLDWTNINGHRMSFDERRVGPKERRDNNTRNAIAPSGPDRRKRAKPLGL